MPSYAELRRIWEKEKLAPLEQGNRPGHAAGRKRVANVAGLRPREDRQLLDLLHVVGDPIDHVPAVAAEVLRAHVPARRFFHLRLRRYSHSMVAGGLEVTS